MNLIKLCGTFQSQLTPPTTSYIKHDSCKKHIK